MLPDHERFRFHFGPYEQPVYAFGDIVECAARGEVEIIRQSDGRIPWPVGFPTGTGNRGRGTLILFGGLKLAIENESSQSVAYWFGVNTTTIAKWRKLLGVSRSNAGTKKLFESALRNDVDRAVKISKARQGKPRTGYTPPFEGRKHSTRSRKQMSQRRTGVLRRRPWEAWEDQLLQDQVSIHEVAKRTHRALRLVRERKQELGLPDGRSSEVRQQKKQ